MTRRFSSLIRTYPFIIKLPYLIFRRIQPRYTLGVVGIVINPKQEVLIVEHVFHPQIPWGLPGGWVDRNEDPAHAVVRELREELDLKIDKVDIVIVEKTFNNHLDLAYLCETSDQVGEISSELLDYRWANRNDLPDLKTFHYKAIELAFHKRSSNEHIFK